MTAPLRHSRLKLMGRSPAHYHAAVERDTTSMAIGSAADALILGGQAVVAYPGKQRRGKEWDAWQADQDPAALIVTQRELGLAQGMAAAVAINPDAMWALAGTIRETLFWKREGLPCRGTPDVRNDARRFLTDLKTSETSDPSRFPWKVRQYAYHAQLAWYRDGIERSGLPRPATCYIVAVEQLPPHVVTVFRLTEHTLDMGDRLNRLWLERLRVCQSSDYWPGYSETVLDLDLPDADPEALDIAGTDGPFTGEVEEVEA